MIPYEELCEALARYRTRHGMANGPSASPNRVQAQVAQVAPVAAAPAPAFIPAATREDFTGPAPDDRTDIHAQAAPREDVTGEIDIDAVDVVEEEEA